jgi:leader peptidase (prepilin peptidase)/N-methyltransferase
MLNELTSIFSENLWLWAGCVFILGLVVGSFLNVVIYRLPIILEREWQAQAAELLPVAEAAQVPLANEKPATFSLSVPRSACPSCNAPIKAWRNIPIVSWLALRGRCAACRNRISARYPLVELVTGVLSAWVAWRFGFSASAACGLILTWSLVALTGIDIDHQLLPDNITLPLLWVGLLAAVLVGATAGTSVPVAPQDSILGAAAGYLSLWLVYHAFRLVTGKEGMGYGDFKLLAALGAWLGWTTLPFVILLSAATGAVWGISMIVMRGRDRASPMPFGPYLAAAGWLAMMYGDSLLSSYLRLSGLR